VLCGTYHSLREEYGVTVTLVRRVWRKGAGQLPAPPSRPGPATSNHILPVPGREQGEATVSTKIKEDRGTKSLRQ
jgi:hypothetical protein